MADLWIFFHEQILICLHDLHIHPILFHAIIICGEILNWRFTRTVHTNRKNLKKTLSMQYCQKELSVTFLLSVRQVRAERGNFQCLLVTWSELHHEIYYGIVNITSWWQFGNMPLWRDLMVIVTLHMLCLHWMFNFTMFWHVRRGKGPIVKSITGYKRKYNFILSFYFKVTAWVALNK